MINCSIILNKKQIKCNSVTFPRRNHYTVKDLDNGHIGDTEFNLSNVRLSEIKLYKHTAKSLKNLRARNLFTVCRYPQFRDKIMQ